MAFTTNAYLGRVDLNPSSTNIINITASSQQYTLPVSGAEYLLIAVGNSVWLRTGSNPTAAVPTTTGTGMCLPEGSCFGPIRLTGPKIALIGASAAGFLCIIKCDRN